MPSIAQLPEELWITVSTFLYLGDIIAFSDAIQATSHTGLQQILRTAAIQDVYSFVLKADVYGVLFIRGNDMPDQPLNPPGSYVRTAGPDRDFRPRRWYRVDLPSNKFGRKFTLSPESRFAMTLNSCANNFGRVKTFESHHSRAPTDEPIELTLRFLRTIEATTSAVVPHVHEPSETCLLQFEKAPAQPTRLAHVEPLWPFCRVRNVVHNLRLRGAIWSHDGKGRSLPFDWVVPFFGEVRVTTRFRKQRYTLNFEWPVIQSCLESVSISFDSLDFPPSQTLRHLVLRESIPESNCEE